MVTCCVAFGPDDSYLFNSPSKWAWKGIPENVRKLMAEEPKAANLNEISFGPDGSYLCVYTKKDGGMMLTRSGLPDSLDKWLVPVAGKGVSAKRDLGSLNVALGPNGSFFAFDKNGAFWSGLPDALEKAIAGKRDAKGNFKSGEYPQSIALGADDTYVLTTVGGGFAWTLTDGNKALKEFLRTQKSLKNIYVILSPVRSDIYMTLSGYGMCSSVIPTTWHPPYQEFSADWRTSCQREINQSAAANRRRANVRQSANVGKSLLKGLSAINHIMNAANGNNSGGGQSFGGGGFDTSNNSFDMSGFWDPINSAASDPIQ